jgi:hypothetical protein
MTSWIAASLALIAMTKSCWPMILIHQPTRVRALKPARQGRQQFRSANILSAAMNLDLLQQVQLPALVEQGLEAYFVHF